MFRLILSDNTLFKSAFKGVEHLVDELQLIIDNDGVRCSALDRPHITFVSLDLKPSLFDEFVVDEPLRLNIDTVNFMKVLGRCKSNDRLILEADDGNLIFTFEGESRRRFKIRLIDLEYDSPTLPDIEYSFECCLPVGILKDTISDVGVFSDKLYIRHDEEDTYLYMSGSNDFGTTTSKYSITPSINGIADGVYTLEKIREFMKSEKFSDTIKIKLGENLPVMVEFNYDDSMVSYLLAPRIEQDE